MKKKGTEHDERAKSATRGSLRNSSTTARANVRAPRGVAALTSAAMLAAMQPAEWGTRREESYTVRPVLDEPGVFILKRLLRGVMQWLRQCLSRIVAHMPGQPLHGRSLQLMEMQSLGEKRFVAVLRVGSQRFLIGGAAASVQLLGEVGDTETKVIFPKPLRRDRA